MAIITSHPASQQLRPYPSSELPVGDRNTLDTPSSAAVSRYSKVTLKTGASAGEITAAAAELTPPVGVASASNDQIVYWMREHLPLAAELDESLQRDLPIVEKALAEEMSRHPWLVKIDHCDDLLITMLLAFFKLQADVCKERGAMAQLTYDQTKLQAQAIVAAGVSAVASALVQGGVQLGMTGFATCKATMANRAEARSIQVNLREKHKIDQRVNGIDSDMNDLQQLLLTDADASCAPISIWLAERDSLKTQKNPLVKQSGDLDCQHQLAMAQAQEARGTAQVINSMASPASGVGGAVMGTIGTVHQVAQVQAEQGSRVANQLERDAAERASELVKRTSEILDSYRRVIDADNQAAGAAATMKV